LFSPFQHRYPYIGISSKILEGLRFWTGFFFNPFFKFDFFLPVAISQERMQYLGASTKVVYRAKGWIPLPLFLTPCFGSPLLFFRWLSAQKVSLALPRRFECPCYTNASFESKNNHTRVEKNPWSCPEVLVKEWIPSGSPFLPFFSMEISFHLE
jgi:hypothetical protein